jgi:glycyl-tRNA synthetase beta chain
LEKAHVIPDREKRKARILEQAQKVAAAQKLTLKRDDALVEEVVGLVEWPVALMGTIDAKFMDLPPEVLTTVMRTHQKYFALNPAGHEVSAQDPAGSRAGANTPRGISASFLITANMEPTDGGKAIISGNERVLRARFSDARFFWDQDRKKPLSDWAKGLQDVTFHAKLGTVADKVERIQTLALALAPQVKADKKLVERASLLCKADLVTGMVGEFAELQGIMGRYYAQQEDPAVANAIRDHYLPLGPSSPVPAAPVSICIALADKLDTLISMFAIGEKPTGSKDPFALRRAALGVIRIILDNNLRLKLKPFFAAVPAKTIALHSAHKKLEKKTETRLKETHKVGKYLTVNASASADFEEVIPDNLADLLYEFFADRLKVQLKDSGIRHDVISAVIADGDDDLVRVVERAKALQDFLSAEDGKNLLIAYKRAANILAIEERKDKTTYAAKDLNTGALKEKEETALVHALQKASKQIDGLMEKENFVETMRMLSELRGSVDHFFDKIMVNADDKELRANRLRLLASIRGSMDPIANFALIEG